MNILEFLIALAAIITFGLVGLAYIAGKYNLLSETNKENKNGKR